MIHISVENTSSKKERHFFQGICFVGPPHDVNWFSNRSSRLFPDSANKNGDTCNDKGNITVAFKTGFSI